MKESIEKLGKLIPEINPQSFNCKYFEDDKNHILDIYETRLRTCEMQGLIIEGLKDLVDELRKSKINRVVVFSLEGNQKSYTVFTDSDIDLLLGVVEHE